MSSNTNECLNIIEKIIKEDYVLENNTIQIIKKQFPQALVYNSRSFCAFSTNPLPCTPKHQDSKPDQVTTLSKTNTERVSYKNFAFTLAEVLVTLGIIGVVSAMTVPSLINNYQRQSYVTQLHKVYNEVQQAASQYIIENNALDLKEAGLSSDSAIDEWMKKHFKIVKDCRVNASDCLAIGEYKRMNGSKEEILLDWKGNVYVLESGAVVMISTPRANGNMSVYIDINGKKGPNIIGRDLFATMLYKNGIMDDFGELSNVSAPLTKEQRETLYKNYCNKTGGYWWGCFGKILNDNWQMTY